MSADRYALSHPPQAIRKRRPLIRRTLADTVLALICCGPLVFSGSQDGLLRVWEPAAYTCVASLVGHERGILSLAASRCEDGAVVVRSGGVVLGLVRGHNLTLTPAPCTYAVPAVTPRSASGSGRPRSRAFAQFPFLPWAILCPSPSLKAECSVASRTRLCATFL